MRRIFLLLLLFTFIFTACQKEFTLTQGIAPTLPGGGSSTPGGSCNSYYSTTPGTNWTYIDNQGENTITILNQDSTINGKTFKKFKSSAYSNGFVREDNGNVYQFANTGTSGNIMMNILRANAAIGEKWRDTSILNGVTEIFEYQILEKNVSLTVNNLNFTNVIHSNFKVFMDSPPFFNNELIQTTDAWFGKCIGPLQSKSVTSFMGTSDTLITKIKSYVIM